MGLLKKLPWGIIAGASAIATFFFALGFVALYVVLGGVAAQTNETAGLFDEWYQAVLFVAALIFALILIGSVTMYILKKMGFFDRSGAKEVSNDENA